MYKIPDYDSKKVLKYPPGMWMSEIKYIKKALSEQAKNKFLGDGCRKGLGNLRCVDNAE